MSSSYLNVLRREGPRDIKTYCGLLYARECAVAAVVAHVVRCHVQNESGSPWYPDSDSPTGIPNASDRWIQRSENNPAATRKLLICGDLFTSGLHGICWRDGIDQNLVWPAIDGLLRRVKLLERFTEEHDCVVLKDIPASTQSDSKSLRSCQFRRLNTSSAMQLTLPERWKRYDDYVEHLNVRHRMGVYRVARDLRRAGLVQKPVESLGSATNRIHELYQSVQRQGEAGKLSLPSGYFSALAGSLEADRYRCSGFYEGQDLIAFVLTLRDGDTAICYSLGWDRARCSGLPILPALLQAVVGDALDLGCRQIDFGRTALKAKAQLGAHPHVSETWIQQSSPVLELPHWIHNSLEPMAHSPLPDPVLPLTI